MGRTCWRAQRRASIERLRLEPVLLFAGQPFTPYKFKLAVPPATCSLRITHFDIKSSNILLTRELTAKVADVGLAR